MGFGSSPPPPTPPPPPPLPPAANPPTYANAGLQATAKQRGGAAKGAGFEGSLFTGPQGAAKAPTAQAALTGILQSGQSLGQLNKTTLGT